MKIFAKKPGFCMRTALMQSVSGVLFAACIGVTSQAIELTNEATAATLDDFTKGTYDQQVSPHVQVLGRTEVKQLIVEEAKNSLVPVHIALALAKVESDFQTNAQSSAGARGVMQIMPQNAAADLGIDADELWNAKLNIQIGLDRLGRLFQQYGTWELALAHYHSGEIEGIGNVAKPKVTSQAYVNAVMRWANLYEAQSTVWAKLQERESDWYPAHTTAPEQSPELTYKAEIEAEPIVEKTEPDVRRKRPLIIWHAASKHHDFGWKMSVDQRRAKARRWLDDFGHRRPRGRKW